MKILVYENRKTNPVAWEADDLPAAKLALFRHFDECWKFYGDLDEKIAAGETPTALKNKLERLTRQQANADLDADYRKSLKVEAIPRTKKELDAAEDLVLMRELLRRARKGDAQAAGELLRMRVDLDCEYENGWQVIEARKP